MAKTAYIQEKEEKTISWWEERSSSIAKGMWNER